MVTTIHFSGWFFCSDYCIRRKAKVVAAAVSIKEGKGNTFSEVVLNKWVYRGLSMAALLPLLITAMGGAFGIIDKTLRKMEV